MSLPKNLRYKEYVWVKVDGDTATLGMTDYGLEATKEIVFIDLPKVGKRLKRGDEFVSMESVKWSGHIASPVSGEVTEVNEALFDDPEKMNKDPYGSWVCKVRMSDKGELKGLMDADAAGRWVKENL